MDVRDVWKTLAILYHKTATVGELSAMNFDCRNDAFEVLVMHGAVLKAGPGEPHQYLDQDSFSLSGATRSLLDHFVLAWRRHGNSNLRVDNSFAFVAMPFDSSWDRVYDTMIEPGVKCLGTGWEVARADGDPQTGSLLDNVANQILCMANSRSRRYRQLIEFATVRLPAVFVNVSPLPFAIVADFVRRLASERAMNSAPVVIVAERR